MRASRSPLTIRCPRPRPTAHAPRPTAHAPRGRGAMIAEGAILNGRYRLDRQIGQGGFARVFLSTDLRLRRLVAIKVLNPELNEDEDLLARFEREAQSIADLDHPN